ncbi:hypothetical protein BDE02_08G167900 [Populus trichocarpa]|nr:hypothetical protein BDE02_08G167900 [Populus trichocarpa]
MAELVRNPRVMKKVQDEVRKCVGNKGRVTESDIDQLEYLRMVIKETLRLHPPAPLLITRETMSHCKVSGHNIYPKMLVQINVWAIGRDPGTGRILKSFSLKDSLIAPLTIKDKVLSTCHLDLVEEFVLVFIWDL